MSNAVPRDFRLLEEAEVSQKLSKDAGFSYGLEDDEGLSMANWTGTITGILGVRWFHDRHLSCLLQRTAQMALSCSIL